MPLDVSICCKVELLDFSNYYVKIQKLGDIFCRVTGIISKPVLITE